MKFADIEARTQRLLRMGTQRLEFEFTDLARQCVPRQRYEAVGHQIRIGRIHAQLRAKILGRLRAAPVLRMQSRVHDQGGRAFQLPGECAPFCFIVAVHTQLVAERRRVQSPAFDEEWRFENAPVWPFAMTAGME